MAAFLGFSLWIALATVMPGLVTLGLAYTGVWIAAPDVVTAAAARDRSEWVIAGIAVAIMVATQALGVVLEWILTEKQWLGDPTTEVMIPVGMDLRGGTTECIDRYAEYDGLYLLLAELRDGEDNQGHLQRASAQFFLTNNSLVSYFVAICVTLSVVASGQSENLLEMISHSGAGLMAKNAVWKKASL